MAAICSGHNVLTIVIFFNIANFIHKDICSVTILFLAATKQLYEWFSPSVRLSVRRFSENYLVRQEQINFQHMEFSHPKSFVMLGSAVRKLICLKGLRASPKNYYGNTTPSMA